MLTLHNVGYQGVFADAILEEHGFAALEQVLPADARAGGGTNFLRAGLRAADRVTTVSPTYAEEIRRPEFGMGLEDVLRARGRDLVGILNGVDYGVWSPEQDPFLREHYDATDLAPKRRIKKALVERLKLAPDVDAPLVGVASRLVEQKGIDLLTAALPTLLQGTSASFTVLGNGDAALAGELRRLADAHRTRVAFIEGYDEALAHEIFAGSDLTVVPSRYEPCGLTQMYALRYGTIPVVRATGGLADTIQHFDAATGLGNGAVFRDADPQGVLWGVGTALAWFADGDAWSRLIQNAMAADFSWPLQVPHYEELYRSCSDARCGRQRGQIYFPRVVGRASARIRLEIGLERGLGSRTVRARLSSARPRAAAGANGALAAHRGERRRDVGPREAPAPVADDGAGRVHAGAGVARRADPASA